MGSARFGSALLAVTLSALSSGGHQRYLEQPSVLGTDSAVAEGNGFLGHVLGSKDVSRQVASRAAEQAGLGPEVMKRLLPLAADLMMGALARQQPAPGAAGLAGGSSLMSMATALVDKDRDGSIVDDLGGMIGRAFGRP